MVEVKLTNPRFLILDLLRGSAAFGILIFHLSGKTKPLNALYILVDFFFVLSGFVLYKEIPKRSNFSDFKKFFKKRINRLIPTAWLVIIISYLAYITLDCLNLISSEKKLEINGITFLSALLFLQFIVPSSAVLLVPMWSLSVELFMNLLVALMGIHRKKINALALISALTLFIGILNDTKNVPTTGWEAFSRGVYGFSCGLFARILFDQNHITRFQIKSAIVVVAFLFVLISWSDKYLILVAPTMAYLICAISNINIQNKYLKNICVVAGEFSYGIYLWHFPIIYFLGVSSYATSITKNSLLFKTTEILLTVILSLCLTKVGLIVLKRFEIFRDN